ncbi:GntR family transcriptional regulator [Pseudonocardia sediminis]|uniref:GntR family transcriptional regulator n=1 Tax=Pseudonocardia sediminis TaxID=1397368 RepID=A0A4Q7V1G8_PSEST|nr:GntR family transcriptional regulator [Pseudonocardia sediminis]RZT87304.1 GntR family transcriptional regulator [Pseudonocardia sediminis]
MSSATARAGDDPGYPRRVSRPQTVRLDRGASRLSHAVYDQLKERLLDGRYAAGEQLSAAELRTEFDVSKQPIMEALRRLSGDGLIDIIPQVGTRVATYQPHEVGDFFVMFGGFEGSIAGIAATRRTAEQLADLDAISRQIDELRSETDVATRSRGYRLWNRRFHEAIHLMAHSRVMAETSRRMWDLSDFLINTTGSPNPLSPALDERHEDHERIRAALHAGDQQTARAEMESHIVRTFDVIQEAEDARGAS